ncbi:MAG TPA: zf-HC2 domain-containing protein [Burkholderiales bacterium]|nr:zf-HC2 domain-containing protein [Burkholderiales bacterium]
MSTCAKPIELEALAAYWLGELGEAAEAPLEEHLFSCEHCTRRLEWLAACAGGVRAAVRDGTIALSLTAGFLEHMKRAGMRIREYPVAPGETINCTIRAEDDAVVSRLEAPLAGVRRVDVLHDYAAGGRTRSWRVENLPFDEAAGEVLLAQSTPALRALPAHTHRMRLLAVEEGAERVLGEYTFAHTPG